MAPSPEMPEQIDRYRILERLGRGSMGDVYLALDPKFDRRIALKVMSGHRLDDDELEELRHRFVVEGRAAGRLNHPGIVTIHDADTDEVTGWPFLAMEWVDGESLRHRLKRDGPLPLARAVDLGAQVARALGYAHRQGVVHRDIKPANLLLHRDGRVKIADFGVAKLVSSSLTLTGQVLGSPNYMAPEQVRAESVDGRTDLFALGVVLYESLAGRPAFAAESLAGITFKIVSVDPRPIQIHNQAVPDALDVLLRRALEKDPRDRFASGAEMAEAFDEVARGLPEESPRSSTRELAVGVPAASTSSTRSDSTVTTRLEQPRRPAVADGATGTGVLGTGGAGGGAAAETIVPPQRRRLLRRLALGLGVTALVLVAATLALRPNAGELADLSRRLGLFDRPSGVSKTPPENPPEISLTEEPETSRPTPPETAPEAVAVPPPPAVEIAREPEPEPARVVLELQSRLRRAYLAAWVDGRRVLVRRLETSGLSARVVGQVYQIEIRVPPGSRVIEAHLSGLSTRLEARGKIRDTFEEGEKRILLLDLVTILPEAGGREDRLELRWKTNDE